MRDIDLTGQFKRDLKREKKGAYGKTLETELMPVLEALAGDEVLASRYRDHALTGAWKGARDCHIRPDLLLIYRKPDARRLLLVRLGSHSQLKL